MSKFTKWLDSLNTISEENRQYFLVPVNSKPLYLKRILDCKKNRWFFDRDTQSYWVKVVLSYTTNMREVFEANYGEK
jgi:hypothetical protein